MMTWIQSIVEWPLSVTVLVIVALSALFSYLMVWQARRLWLHPVFVENHELVGFTCSVYGLIGGVFLAFINVVAWQRFSDTIHDHQLLLLISEWAPGGYTVIYFQVY